MNYITSPGSTFTIERIYSYGNLTVANGTKAATVAGFIGSNASGATTVVDSYFNSDNFAVGIGTGGALAGVSGLSTAQLQNSANYTGWDFTNVWVMDSTTNLPRLRNVPLH